MSFLKTFIDNAVSLCTVNEQKITHIEKLKRNNVVALAGVWENTSDWFGTLGVVHAAPVCTLIAFSLACTTVAAESHRVGEDRVGAKGTAGQYGCTVLHPVIGTASLKKEACAKGIPHVAVLITTQTQE